MRFEDFKNRSCVLCLTSARATKITGGSFMFTKITELEPLWYAVHTHPKQEIRAEDNLRAWNIETFTPQFKERREHPFTGEPFSVVKPLFTGYIFARFDRESLYHKVRFTRGVHSLVGFADGPVPVDEEIINAIRSRIGKDGFVRVGERLMPGDQVIIKEGPLKDFTGIFEREMKESERVMILLNAVNYQARALVEKSMLKKALSFGVNT
jgi:transcriptional antiterminator RfaH